MPCELPFSLPVRKESVPYSYRTVLFPHREIPDDSFSALDLKTDAILRKELAANVSDATVIIVAQRISTILHADQILVLDDGKIVGKGTHEELMKTCETYQQIASSQLSAKELGKEA